MAPDILTSIPEKEHQDRSEGTLSQPSSSFRAEVRAAGHAGLSLAFELAHLALPAEGVGFE